MGNSHAENLPFDVAPCQCVRYHSPKPARTEQHHIYPQSYQRKAHNMIVDKETIPLCDTGHATVHVAIEAILNDKPYRLGNLYLRQIALDGVKRILNNKPK